MAGRKTVLIDYVQAEIIKSVAKGVPIKIAVKGAGVSESAYYVWIKRGEAGEKPFVEFMELIDKAKKDLAESCLDDIKKVRRGGTWQAAAWMLERKFREDFGKPADDQIVNQTNNTYLIAIKVAADEDKVQAIHDAIASSTKLVSNPGGNGVSD